MRILVKIREAAVKFGSLLRRQVRIKAAIGDVHRSWATPIRSLIFAVLREKMIVVSDTSIVTLLGRGEGSLSISPSPFKL